MGANNMFGGNVEIPTELCEMILELATGGVVERTNHPPNPLILQWRLTNSAWYHQLSPFFYRSFTFHSNPNQIEKLWSFLRMLVTQPLSRDWVRQVTISTVELFKPFQPRNIRKVFLLMYNEPSLSVFRRSRSPQQAQLGPPITDSEKFNFLAVEYLDADGVTIKPKYRIRIRDWYYRALYHSNKNWLDQALTDVGFNQGTVDLKARAERALTKGTPSEGYQCPLTALILAYCPGLHDVSLHTWRSADDPWFDKVLGYALGASVNQFQLNERPLQRLRSLAIAPKYIRPKGSIVQPDDPAIISDVRPYYRLPSLVEFTGIHVNTDRRMIEADPQPTPSTVQRLMLKGPSIRAHQLDLTLNLCPNLRQLSLYIPGFLYCHHLELESQDEVNGAALYASLWTMLMQFKDQLEYLDLYQEEISYGRFDDWFINDEGLPQNFCPPLPQFTRLRHLNITLLLLAGHYCRCRSPDKLRNHLPPNLESLGLYTDCGNYRNYLTNEADELREIVLQGSLLPGGALRSIALDTGFVNWTLDQKMERAARHRGIAFTRNARSLLFFGGLESPWADTTMGDAMASVAHLRVKALNRVAERVIPIGMKVQKFEGNLEDGRHQTNPGVDSDSDA